MAAGGQLPAQGDRREGVPWVAEGGEQEPPRVSPGRLDRAGGRGTQAASSARSWTILRRESKSKAIGVQMSVPTPASR